MANNQTKSKHSERSTATSEQLAAQRRLEIIYGVLQRTYPTFDQTDDPWMTNGLSSTPFRCLVSVCLSTMTITPRVVKACVPLFDKVSSFEELLALDDEELRAIIKPVAHYNRKTTNLKIMCRQILETYHGKIPETHEELMKLQGVGRKVADIMMNFIFNEDTIEGVRPTSAAIDAMRVWQLAEEAVSKVYGEPVTLRLEDGQLCALADKVFS